MRFPYQGYPVRNPDQSRSTLIDRPSALVRIIGPAGDALAYGLLDTGADDTLLPANFVVLLGVVIRPELRTTIGGFTGEAMTANFGTVDLELRRRKTVYRWSAIVGFCDIHKAILGQSGVLEYFLASFNHRLRLATLRPNGTLPPPVVET